MYMSINFISVRECIHVRASRIVVESRAGFHNHLILVKFNPKYSVHNLTYFRQNSLRMLKTESIVYL